MAFGSADGIIWKAVAPCGGYPADMIDRPNHNLWERFMSCGTVVTGRTGVESSPIGYIARGL